MLGGKGKGAGGKGEGFLDLHYCNSCSMQRRGRYG